MPTKPLHPQTKCSPYLRIWLQTRSSALPIRASRCAATVPRSGLRTQRRTCRCPAFRRWPSCPHSARRTTGRIRRPARSSYRSATVPRTCCRSSIIKFPFRACGRSAGCPGSAPRRRRCTNPRRGRGRPSNRRRKRPRTFISRCRGRGAAR